MGCRRTRCLGGVARRWRGGATVASANRGVRGGERWRAGECGSTRCGRGEHVRRRAGGPAGRRGRSVPRRSGSVPRTGRCEWIVGCGPDPAGAADRVAGRGTRPGCVAVRGRTGAEGGGQLRGGARRSVVRRGRAVPRRSGSVSGARYRQWARGSGRDPSRTAGPATSRRTRPRLRRPRHRPSRGRRPRGPGSGCAGSGCAGSGRAGSGKPGPDPGQTCPGPFDSGPAWSGPGQPGSVCSRAG
ncbi:hypothetical protein CryarDRAFT_1814 [Cryptosporangium arvum DSM 44712]|uniref:Uncharacterized protein n=1 Tax=Cryptosporangium arvum DSM 44712 TaxID=927661 RepID=A0A011AFD3_9ACTN|nr:hypothetical protein CryarDRAFT_1814 [Cryptosporangium arvum DSM 44712]